MYRAEAPCLATSPRTSTVIVDLAQRSAALDRGDGLQGRHSLLHELRQRAEVTEILLDAVDGLEDELLLVYRAARATDEGSGAILFRRQRPAGVAASHPPAVHTLAQVLFDSLRAEAPNTPLLAHVALALRAILPCTPGRDDPGTQRGGLASWQERRAIAYMEERLDQSFPVADVAEACGLSVNHFSRAFRRSIGKPPHRWLLDRRIQRAQDMLRINHLSLADIALSCGFAEQSHFTRVFTRTVGMPPGAWRRSAD
jgi:AraC-like DNA-binding protein